HRRRRLPGPRGQLEALQHRPARLVRRTQVTDHPPGAGHRLGRHLRAVPPRPVLRPAWPPQRHLLHRGASEPGKGTPRAEHGQQRVLPQGRGRWTDRSAHRHGRESRHGGRDPLHQRRRGPLQPRPL
ncbi:MAG: hypothetical protein AVDCRST_MAG60-1098, partial [uncultured Nocardioides sp.]